MHNFGYFEEGHASTLSDGAIWLRTLSLLRPFILPFSAAVALSLLVTASTLGLPWLMQRGIDLYIIDTSHTLDFRLAGLVSISIFYAALITVNFITSFAQVIILEWMGQSIMHRLRQDLFGHLLQLRLSFFNRQPVGRLVTRVTNDIQNMHEMFTSIMVTLFNDLLKMLCIIILLIFFNHKLGLLLCLFVPLAATMTFLFARLARNIFRDIRRQLSVLNSFIQETVSGIHLVQIFGRSASIAADFAKLNNIYLARTLRQIKLFGTFMPLTELMSSLAIAVILWYGGTAVLEKTLSLGELVAFLSYMRLFFQPLRDLSQKYSIVQSAMASAERIFHLLDNDNGESDNNKRQLIAPFTAKGDINFNGVNFSYTKNHPVLHDINLIIEEGTKVAIVGPTGSGKTTLINLILRFYEPDSGIITIADHDLRQTARSAIREKTGVVLQEMLILQDTLLANIRLDTDKSEEEITQILAEAQLSEFINQLPEGLHSRIGEGGRSISTGEKQLLAISRALCRDPDILILDEASSAIDSRTEELLEHTLETSFRGKTIIIIAHRLSTVKGADKIIVLAGGQIREQGDHRQLLAKNGLYKRLLTMDLE